ncbi:hypothetical protein KKP04_12340 [Rhodomicrobium sp. Az07]|uniref:hypothetical protein n=1 Tax=Rhodomicrobium sp. Az07 TaxID=2839034 RepID=UPI001BE6B8AD|nr:hypothetical protein [Rhodomicrobium sp. Az07]MBT3071655.1 hypothetical protein [Rhodomicrobium sp. Az07]
MNAPGWPFRVASGWGGRNLLLPAAILLSSSLTFVAIGTRPSSRTRIHFNRDFPMRFTWFGTLLIGSISVAASLLAIYKDRDLIPEFACSLVRAIHEPQSCRRQVASTDATKTGSSDAEPETKPAKLTSDKSTNQDQESIKDNKTPQELRIRRPDEKKALPEQKPSSPASIAKPNYRICILTKDTERWPTLANDASLRLEELGFTTETTNPCHKVDYIIYFTDFIENFNDRRFSERDGFFVSSVSVKLALSVTDIKSGKTIKASEVIGVSAPTDAFPPRRKALNEAISQVVSAISK